MVGYLAAYEAKNNGCIPCVRSIDRIGWIDREFYPYHVDGAMELETDAASVSQMIGGLTQEGSLEAWLKAAEIVRAGSVSRAVLAGSFASPLLHWLKQRVFLEHHHQVGVSLRTEYGGYADRHPKAEGARCGGLL